MNPTPPNVPAPSPKLLWAGRIISAAPVLMLLMSAYMKLARPPEVVDGFLRLGFQERLAVGLAVFEIACTLVYIFPATAVLGAILLTGYLGGATATHVRVGDPFWAPVFLGFLVWIGLYLREPRLRTLVPWRTSPRAGVAPRTTESATAPVLK